MSLRWQVKFLCWGMGSPVWLEIHPWINSKGGGWLALALQIETKIIYIVSLRVTFIK